MRALAWVLAVALAGCVPSAGGYERMLDGWLGASEAELIARWGVPLGSYDSGSSRFLTYDESRIVSDSGSAPVVVRNRAAGTVRAVGGSDPAVTQYQCRTVFELKGGRVAAWRFSGNGCLAAGSSAGGPAAA